MSTTVPRMSAASAGFVTEPVGFVLSTRTVIVAEVKELPALSVVTTRRSYWPSACRVVFQLAAWFVQLPAPAGERWKVTVSIPEPPSAELLVSVTVPRMSAASAGAVIEPVGFVLSTRTVTVAEVKELPALSVVTTRRSYWPSACRLVFQLAAWFVQVPAPIGERWNWTVATPEPPASEELLVSETVPWTLAASAGAVTEPVGLVPSTSHVYEAAEASRLPAASVGAHLEGVGAVSERAVGLGARAGAPAATVDAALEGRAALGGGEGEGSARRARRIGGLRRDRRVRRACCRR